MMAFLYQGGYKTSLSCYTFSKKLKKLHWKIWIKKKTSIVKRKNLKPLKELLSSFNAHFWKKLFPNNESHCTALQF